MSTFLSIVIAYLLGSVAFGVIVPKAQGLDIYAVGSGNPGTSNVFRSVGKRAAALVMLGDLLKGTAAAAIGALWVGSTVGYACMLAATAGHVWPVWHRFRGGRGVATSLGAVAWLSPLWGILVAVGWTAVVVITKTASIASLGAMVVLVPGLLVAGVRGWSLVWATATVALVIARHAGNIQRLFAGEERAIVGEEQGGES